MYSYWKYAEGRGLGQEGWSVVDTSIVQQDLRTTEKRTGKGGEGGEEEEKKETYMGST